jgi:hypothetical protein
MLYQFNIITFDYKDLIMFDLSVFFGFIDNILIFVIGGLVGGVLLVVIGVFLSNNSSNVNQSQSSGQPQSNNIVCLSGIGGRLDVYDNKIIIVRSGGVSFLLHGLKGDKTLYYHQITSLQLKKADGFTNGYIQFSIQGGRESTGGILAATQDENTIMFNQTQNDHAQRIHDLIERKLLEAQTSKQTSVSAPISVTDEIAKMKKLLDSGVISQEEFNAFKKKMLGI